MPVVPLETHAPQQSVLVPRSVLNTPLEVAKSAADLDIVGFSLSPSATVQETPGLEEVVVGTPGVAPKWGQG